MLTPAGRTRCAYRDARTEDLGSPTLSPAVRCHFAPHNAGIEDLDAVVSTVGGTVDNPEADGQGNINLINAAAAAGVKKFVLVTSIGTGDSKDAPSPEVYKTLEPVLLEKAKAEDALKVRLHRHHFAQAWPLGYRRQGKGSVGAGPQ